MEVEQPIAADAVPMTTTDSVPDSVEQIISDARRGNDPMAAMEPNAKVEQPTQSYQPPPGYGMVPRYHVQGYQAMPYNQGDSDMSVQLTLSEDDKLNLVTRLKSGI